MPTGDKNAARANGEIPSAALIVQDYLNKQEAGGVYSAAQVYDMLKGDNPTITPNGVSAFMSRAAHAGQMKSERNGRGYLYTLDGTISVAMRYKAGPGSFPGRDIGERHLLHPGEGRKYQRRRGKNSKLTIDDVREQLLNLACVLETIKPSLSTFSNDELLAELTKRNRASK